MRKQRSDLWLWEICKYTLGRGKPEDKMDKDDEVWVWEGGMPILMYYEVIQSASGWMSGGVLCIWNIESNNKALSG